MPEALEKLEFSLDDVVDGVPLTPDNVDMPTLLGFLEDVNNLVKGNSDVNLTGRSRARIEEGSLKVVLLVAVSLASGVKNDMAAFVRDRDLDVIDPSRAKILRSWDGQAKRHPTRSYKVNAGAGAQPFILSAQSSRAEHKTRDTWFDVEKYYTGKVMDLGGKAPNIHLLLSGEKTPLTISATEEQLRAEKENRLYKEATLLVSAERNLRTGELRNLRLKHFFAPPEEVDWAAMETLWERGKKAWAGIPDAVAWVRELRGDTP